MKSIGLNKGVGIIFLGIIFSLTLSVYGQYGGGTGEADNPFLIYDPNQMNEIGLHPEHWGKHFRLMNDIDLGLYTSTNYNIIGRQVTVTDPYGIALDLVNGKFYWTDYGTDRVRCVSLDTTDFDDIIIYTQNDPHGIAVDTESGKIYWVNFSSSKICRANLDGSNIETLITTGISYPSGIALDTSNGKMYWTTNGNRKIQRANLDGTAIEDLVATGLVYPNGITLDLIGNKIYWTDYGTNKIQRSNLDGTNIEDLITTGIFHPLSIALDLYNSKMYWTDNETNKIHRANLDGTNIEDLITTGLDSPCGIALDLSNDKMYWTDSGTNKIQRANLDGTGIEDLLPLPSFTGSFDGNGHTISNLTYDSPSADYVGIFQTLGSSAEVKNLNLLNIHINIDNGSYIGSLAAITDYRTTVDGCNIENVYLRTMAFNTQNYQCIGGLIGYNNGTIKNCTILGQVEGINQVGGIVGYNYGSIENCHADIIVNGNMSVGGLVGFHETSAMGVVKSCFSQGSIYGVKHVGGLVGYNYGSNRGQVTGCYSSAGVTGSLNVGGLVGYNTGNINGSYSIGVVNGSENVGGLVGSGSETLVQVSFWDIETTGLLTSCGGVGKTTAELQTASLYEREWVCVETPWTIVEGEDYPRLLWENRPGILIERDNYGGGIGTPDDPFLIYTAEQFCAIGHRECDWNKHFKLMSDIDFETNTGEGFKMVGDYNTKKPFIGDFDGNGHTIFNFTYNATGINYLGLFGYLGMDGTVKNVDLTNVIIDANAANYIGALVGYNIGTIFACCADVFITNGGNYIGGLAGISNGSIENCYTHGTVEGINYVGGLVGINHSIINSCYSTASIIGNQYKGGLVGYNNTNACIKRSFWDINASGISEGIGYNLTTDVAMGKTTTEMKKADTFLVEGWDFVGEMTNGPSDIWAEPTAVDYMILWWKLDPNDLPSLPTFSGGIGSQQDPYVISTTSDICSIGCNPRLMNSHFLLINDIDLFDSDFHSIGNQAYYFQGVFDGDGYELKNLNMDRYGEMHVGFFGYTDGNCLVKNLGLVNVNVETENCQYVGGLVGGCSNNTQIRRCYVSGKISGNKSVGGLLGRAVDSQLQECFSEGIVLANGTYSYAGGLVCSFNNSSAVNSFSTAAVTSYEQSGGLFSYCGLAKVENCYAAGPVEATYYNGKEGGLVGYYDRSEYLGCFWDVDTTGRSSALGNSTEIVATGKSTPEMMMANTFINTGWDLTDIWCIMENVSYPYLRAMPLPPPMQAYLNLPSKNAVDIDPSNTLTWKAGSGATSHDIYFGPTNPPIYIGNQTETIFAPALEYNTTYYWRIDEIGPGGMTPGKIWSFSTISWPGEGTVQDPFIINNPEALYALASNPEKLNKYYQLGCDIDLTNYYKPNFSGINGFTGVFDGNYHSIINFKYTLYNSENAGLFPILENKAIIQNLTLVNPQIKVSNTQYVGSLVGKLRKATLSNIIIEGGRVNGHSYVGGLVGSLYCGEIFDCHCSCDVNGVGHYIGGLVGQHQGAKGTSSITVSKIRNSSAHGSVTGSAYVGGLVGYNGVVDQINYAYAYIYDSYASGDIYGTARVGGLAGSHRSGGSIYNCKASGKVIGTYLEVGGFCGQNYGFITSSCSTGTVEGGARVGGFVGDNSMDGEIKDCYANGSVRGTSKIGGLIGVNSRTVSMCYSNGAVSGSDLVGGLIGSHILLSDSSTKFSFWDIETSGCQESAAGEGKTTTEMKTAETYIQWICENTWGLDEGVDYPRLTWENLSESLISDYWFAGGKGTTEEPYLIETVEQLNLIDSFDCLLEKDFKMIADIDLSNYNGQDGNPVFNVIGDNNREFFGTFDGNYHTISNLTFCPTQSDSYVGLFGCVGHWSGSEIKNLYLINPNIDAISGDYIGALAGKAEAYRIINCHVMGGNIKGNRYIGGLLGFCTDGITNNCSTTADVGGSSYVGGFAGLNSSEMNKCYAMGSVSGTNRIGGLIGEHSSQKVSQCFATGNISQEGYSPNFFGGLIGYVWGNGWYAYIINSYATGTIGGTFYVGGLIGCCDDGVIRQCYATGSVSGVSNVGGLIGDVDNSVATNSFWDKWTTHQSQSAGGGTGLITPEMKIAGTYINAGWDFRDEEINGTEDIWSICQASNYPKLSWLESSSGDFACPDGVGMEDLMLLTQEWLVEGASNADIAPAPDGDGAVNLLDFAILSQNWLMDVEY